MDDKKARIGIIKIYAVIFAIGGAYALIILLTGFKIPCIYADYFHGGCPTCGITRMCLSMMKLDFVRAFNYNPMCFILFFLWNIISLFYFWGKPRVVRKPKFLYFMLGFSVFLLYFSFFLRSFC